MNESKRKPDLFAYMVTGTTEKPFYTKIGAAWKNKKGGYGIRLEAYPVNGDIVLFPPKDKEETGDSK